MLLSVSLKALESYKSSQAGWQYDQSSVLERNTNEGQDGLEGRKAESKEPN